MARKKKRKKQPLWLWWLLGALALLLLIGGVSYFFGDEGIPFNIGDDGADVTAGGGGGSGGGGGGSAAGDNCEPVWVSDLAPMKWRDDFVKEVQKVGDIDKVDMEGIVVNPGVFAGLGSGRYECAGTCANEAKNCMLNPTDNIPEGGFTVPGGEKPDCVCLAPNPGDCNWYDDDYGEDDDMDLKCGGFCKKGDCESWVENGREWCDCLSSEVECGFHDVTFDGDGIDGFLMMLPYSEEQLKEMCYGECYEDHDECDGLDDGIPFGKLLKSAPDKVGVVKDPIVKDFFPLDRCEVSDDEECYFYTKYYELDGLPSDFYGGIPFRDRDIAEGWIGVGFCDCLEDEPQFHYPPGYPEDEGFDDVDDGIPDKGGRIIVLSDQQSWWSALWDKICFWN